jgi:hypothetical protein
MPSIRLDEGLSLHWCRPAIAKRHQLFKLFWITQPVWRGSRESPFLQRRKLPTQDLIRVQRESRSVVRMEK